MRHLTADVSLTVKNTFLEIQPEQDSLSLLSACGSESGRAATEPTPSRRKWLGDSDSYAATESTDCEENLTKRGCSGCSCSASDDQAGTSCKLCDEACSSAHLEASRRGKRGSGLRKPRANERLNKLMENARLEELEDARRRENIAEAQYQAELKRAEDTDADEFGLLTRHEMPDSREIITMLEKLHKATAHYTSPVQKAVKLAICSKDEAVTVTFQPGVLGFDVEDGKVVKVHHTGQARREGVKCGWCVKAVDGQTCSSFFDDAFQSAKDGTKPYQVTFLLRPSHVEAQKPTESAFNPQEANAEADALAKQKNKIREEARAMKWAHEEAEYLQREAEMKAAKAEEALRLWVDCRLAQEKEEAEDTPTKEISSKDMMGCLAMDTNSQKLSLACLSHHDHKTKMDRDFMKLWYCRDEPNSGEPTPITMIAGFFTHLRAQVNIASGETPAWTNHVKFVVEPSLPEGLHLNECTGGISGVPFKVQEKASTHCITANIAAYAPGGVSIGLVELARCNLVARVVDAANYVVTWSGEDTDQVVLKLALAENLAD